MKFNFLKKKIKQEDINFDYFSINIWQESYFWSYTLKDKHDMIHHEKLKKLCKREGYD